MIVQQHITAEQKEEMRELAKRCKAKVSFGGPRSSSRITITSKCFTGQYPNTLDGYNAAKATMEKMVPKQKESEK